MPRMRADILSDVPVRQYQDGVKVLGGAGQFRSDDLLEDIAARLYWSLVSRVGMPEATRVTIETHGWALLGHPSAQWIIDRYGSSLYEAYPGVSIFKALAGFAATAIENQRHLSGIIHIDRRLAGRSPDSKVGDTSSLAMLPRAFSVEARGALVARCGRLYLRHPMPAVVLVDRPVESCIKVLLVDTREALGFDMPLLFSNFSMRTVRGVARYACAAVGVFRIPVPWIEQAALWVRVIQNATYFTRRSTFLPDVQGGVTVNLKW